MAAATLAHGGIHDGHGGPPPSRSYDERAESPHVDGDHVLAIVCTREPRELGAMYSGVPPPVRLESPKSAMRARRDTGVSARCAA